MRHFKTIAFSLFIFLAISENVFARDFCEFESTAVGQKLRAINYILVADLNCRSYGYDQKYISFGKFSIADRQDLQRKGEQEFEQKLKSPSCKAELGSLDKRGARAAFDKWTTAAANKYSHQAVVNRTEFCQQAIEIIDQYMKNGLKSQIQVKTIETLQQANQKMQAPKIQVIPEQSVPLSVTTISQVRVVPSKSSYSGGLQAPASHSSVYQALLPTGFDYNTLPAIVFVPGIGYVPSAQIGSVYGTYGGAVSGSK